MGKKSFRDLNPAMQFISNHAQDVQRTQEVQEVQEDRKSVSKTTQGRKGQKLPRINMAFLPENLEYLQVISRIEGVSITEYVNRLIDSDRAERSDLLEAAKNLFRG